jgi:hypothetical protein
MSGSGIKSFEVTDLYIPINLVLNILPQWHILTDVHHKSHFHRFEALMGASQNI